MIKIFRSNLFAPYPAGVVADYVDPIKACAGCELISLVRTSTANISRLVHEPMQVRTDAVYNTKFNDDNHSTTR